MRGVPPRSVVRFVPPLSDRAGQCADKLPVPVPDSTVHFGQSRDQLDDRTENVELHLLISQVPDANRSGARIAGQRQLCFWRQPTAVQGVERAQPFRAGQRLNHSMEPVQERFRLPGRPE